MPLETVKLKYVAATDLEMGIRTRIPGQIVESGAITIPAKEFASVIKALSAAEVKLIASVDRARICCERSVCPPASSRR